VENAMKNFTFSRILSMTLAGLHYHRIRVLHPERLPLDGPVLYLGLHRNGAVDGYVYASFLPRATFMISTQLRRNPLGRLFFRGIEVARPKDLREGGLRDNRQAIRSCVEHIVRGGALFVMPEGSSELGFKHLPFKSGAARILQAALIAGTNPVVVPMGIHYEAAREWQSDVEVVVGNPVDTMLPAGLSDTEALHLLQERITEALETVGVNGPDALTFTRWEQIAYAATLGTGRRYFHALKALEQGGVDLTDTAVDLQSEISAVGAYRHQGVPLIPLHHSWAYVVYALLLSPLVFVALLVNLPPVLAAWFAGRHFADGPNTIALWRLLAGLPVLLIWSLCVLVAATAMSAPWYWLVYSILSWLGLRSVYRLKKLLVSLGNLLRVPGLRAKLLTWHRMIDRAMTEKGV
jgi:1-acyl-sn-glycerol-3-phosphate acyltransferase